VLHDNVIAVHPRTAADSGNNATVDALMLSTGQLSLTSTALSTPLTPGAKSITFTAGTVCAANTPDAGKKAYPNLGYWSSISQRVPTITNAPGNVVLSNHMLLTFSFLPKNVDPALPATITISQTFANAASATTTTVATTSTTAATTTTTTAPTTTTTTKK